MSEVTGEVMPTDKGCTTPTLHHITDRDVPTPYRWRCVKCGRLFKIAPNSIRVEGIYFEAQTGIIRETPAAESNFYQYHLSESDRPFIEAALAKAVPGCGGLEYEDGFLRTLDKMELKHRQQLRR